MYIFECLISGQELFSDTFKFEEVEGGLLYKVTGKMVSETTDIDERMFGGNVSAEGGADEASDGSIVSQGLDIALNHKLIESPMSRKDYTICIKEYCKKLAAKLIEMGKEEEANKFKESAKAFIPKMLKEYKEYTTYVVGNYDTEAMIGLLRWEDETIPHMYYFKAGCDKVKV